MNKHIPKVGFVSLGCPKALVDSERMITQLRAQGYELSSTYENADVVVVNTCGFIESAIDESLSTIQEAMEENGKVIVTGCLGKNADLIQEKFPNVLGVSGPQAYETVINTVHEHVPPRQDPFTSLVPPQGIKLTPAHYAYLKISEGCNHKCTFCIIPDLRGKLVSRPISDVMTEAQRLAQAGVKELLVISQDTSAYGIDTKYKLDCWNGKPLKTRFYDLVDALSDLNIWVRLHYVYPYPHVDDVIPLMAQGKILPYLDIPFQHGNQRILKLMKRPACTENVLQRIQKWREICPEIAIRSTFIVGFPGETEAEFNELLDFIEEAQLDRVGCFTYSDVEGARSNALPGQVDEEEKLDRLDRFMHLQAQISANKLHDKIGTKQDVIVDRIAQEGAIARSKADAPEIDGIVLVEDGQQCRPGDIITVNITDADEHDLVGSIAST